MKRDLWLVELMAAARSTDRWERRRSRAIVLTIVSVLRAVLLDLDNDANSVLTGLDSQ